MACKSEKAGREAQAEGTDLGKALGGMEGFCDVTFMFGPGQVVAPGHLIKR